MKKIVRRFMVIFFVVFIAMAISERAYAEEVNELYEISSQIDDILDEYDIGYEYSDMEDLSFSSIFTSIKDAAVSRISAPIKLMGIILLIIIFYSMMKNIGDSAFTRNTAANIYNQVCILSAVAVISPSMISSYEYAADSVDKVGGFIQIFVPVFAGISIVSGEISAGAIYNVMTLTAAEIMIQFSRNILIPLLSVSTALAISGSVFHNSAADGIMRFTKKLITWTLTITVTLFTGFLTLKSSIGNAADGFASKTAKFMISGFVPVVGGAISDAYSTVKSSMGIIRCTTGTAGAIAIVIIMIPPVLELMAYRLVFMIGSAAAEMMSVTPIVRLFKNLDSGLAIAMSVLICFSVFFIISTAILMNGI
jgi:stage III sporulation protein AE